MKHIRKNISILLVVLATLSFLFVGCSDMMVKMGEIVLQIEPEDTIRTSVHKYSIVGNLASSRSSVSFDNLSPGGEVVIPNIAPGTWAFTVVAFDKSNNEIGRGTKDIVLTEGQKMDLKIPVVFVPLPLSITDPILTSLSKVYDGTTTLAVKSGTLSGMVAGDEKIKVVAKASYNDKSVGSGKRITVTHTLVYSDDTAITGKYASPSDYIVDTGVITAKQLAISDPSFPETKDRVYDGTNSLAVTAGSLIGIVEGDDVTVSATAAYDNKNATSDKAITVTYTLGGPDAANYFKPVDNTANTGNIAKKPLYFTVEADDKTYNGDTTAVGTVTLTGVQEDDANEVGATGIFTFTDETVASGKVVTVTAIELTGSEKENYSLSGTTASTTATISKKTFDMNGISFADQSQTYDGNAHSLAIGGILPVGVRVTYSGNNSQMKAGAYEVIATFSVDEANHETIPDRTATLTIRKRALTTEGTYLTLSKAFDKNASVYSTVDQEKSGKVAGDDMHLAISASYTDKSGSIGEGKAISVSYTLSGSDAANYTKPADYSVYTGTIVPIQLAIGNPSLANTSKMYDGNTSIPVTKGSLNGILTGDSVSVTAKASYDTKDVGTNKAITVVYTLVGEDKAHYRIPAPYTLYTGVILPLQLSITSPTFPGSQNKVYDGSRNLNVQAGTLEGVLSGDSVTIGTTAQYANKDEGSDKEIIISYVLAGKDFQNYIAPVNITAYTGTITAKHLTISKPIFPNTTNRPYDGKTSLPVIAGTLSGVVSGDWISVNAEATYADKDIGDAKAITVRYTIEGPNAGNYLAPSVDATSYTGNITGSKLTISDPILEKTKVYDGTIACQVVPGSMVSGIVGSDDVQVTASASFDTEDFGTNKTITVQYVLTGNDKGKYIAPEAYILRSGKIEKKQLTMSDLPVPTLSKEYDGTGSVAFTAGTVSGVYGTDDVEIREEGYYQEPGVGSGKGISFAYSLTGTDAKNYLAPPMHTIRTGKITKKALTVGSGTTVIETAKTYDGNQSAKVTNHGNLVGVVSGEDVKLEARASYNGKSVGTGKSISVTYFLNGSDAGNYTFPAGYSIQGGSIGAKPLGAGVPNFIASTSKMYDGNNTLPVTAGALIGVLGNDDVSLSAVASYESANAMRNNKITVEYTLAGGDSNNYSKPADYTVLAGEITPIQLTISKPSLANTSKKYDGNTSIPVTKGSLNGVLTGDSVSVTATASYDDKDVGTNKKITVSYALDVPNANYLGPISYTTNTGVITAIQLSMGNPSLSTLNKTYDGKDNVSGSLTLGALGGILPGEQGTVTVQAIATYADKNVGTGKTVTVSYTLDEASANAKNYLAPVSYSFNSGVITAKKLTIADPTFSTVKTYDGSDVCQVYPSYAVTGIAESDRVQVQATGTFDSKRVGTAKTITVSYSLVGADKGQYEAPDNFVTSQGKIEKKLLLIEKPTIPNTSKEYDGTNSIVFTAGNLIGICGTDSVDVDTDRTLGFYDNENIKDDKQIFFIYELKGSDAANYERPRLDLIKTGQITPKALSVTGTLVTSSKEYDGGLAAAVTSAGTLDGFVAGLEDVTLTATASYADKKAGNPKDITVRYELGGKDSSKYKTPADMTIHTGIITPKQLTIDIPIFPVGKDRVYNGKTTLEVSASVLNSIGEDDVSANATATYANGDAGQDKAITVTYELVGADRGNYIKPDATTGITGTITPKPLSISANTLYTMTYSGNPGFSTSVPTEGILEADTHLVYVYGHYRLLDVNVGIDNVASLDSMEIRQKTSPDKRGNYSILPEAVGKVTVIPKPLTFVVSADNKPYDGKKDATGSISLIGKVGSDDVGATGTFEFVNAELGDSKTVNVRDIHLGGAKKGNYSLETTTATTQAKIYKATYDMSGITFTGATSTYDGNIHSLAITGTLPSGVTVSYSNNNKTNSGEYLVTASFTGDATNYIAIPSKTATLTIQKAAMTGTLSINGTAKEGQVLTYSSSLVTGSNPSYQWKRDGVDISLATGTSYTLVAADVGKRITVTATARGANYTGSITSPSTAIIVSNAPPAPAGTIEAYNPTSPSDQNIINLTGFVPNAAGLEAAVSLNGTAYDTYQALTVDGRGRARIYLSGNAIANTTKVKVRVAAAGTVSAGIDREFTLGSKALSVGDYYQGGIIAYLGSFTAIGSGTKQGLIAAETDQTDLNVGIDWCNQPFVLVGVDTGTNGNFGAGLANTNKIIEEITKVRGASYTKYAAFLARCHNGGAYSDWFLPSQNEIKKLYDNQDIIGNFAQDQVYWSSTESLQHNYEPLSAAQVKPFNTTGEWVEYKDRMHGAILYPIQVRAVRYF